MKTKKSGPSWLLWIALLGALGTCVVGVAAVVIFFNPLGPALEISNIIPNASQPTATSTSEASAPAQDEPAQPAPTATAEGVCGETAVWNVLVVGSDAADMNYPPGSDLTRVVRVDFQNKSVTSFAFSRDLWVDTSSLGLKAPDIAATKLGMVFHESRLRSLRPDPKEVMLDGVNAMANALALNFNVISDHYIALDLAKLPEMIDAIGGLPINIPEPLTDTVTDTEFAAGQQILTGLQATIYARAYTKDDLSRIERNNLVVEALRQRLLDPAVWTKIPELYLKYKDFVITDFSPEQVSQFACLLQEVESESIVQVGVKPEWTSPGKEGSLLWDRAKVMALLKELEIVP
jgi:LCP family protein required for cell wall assembly